jgi:nucleotide-binding universal stress UspA family protein
MDARETTQGTRGPSWVTRIVVAADGSPASNEGLEKAADLAQRTGAKVFVLHIRHLPAAALMASGVADQSVQDALDEQESDIRQHAIRILGGTGIDRELVLRVGSAGEEIVKAVKELNADLVMVGSNRHSSLHNLLLGSTAAYLTAHSPVPVLIMRPTARQDTPLQAASSR